MIFGMYLKTFLVLLFFIGVGIVDEYLIYKGKKTISQKVQAWTQNQWVDLIIFIGCFCLVWWIFTPNAAIPLLGGGILGHFFLSREKK